MNKTKTHLINSNNLFSHKIFHVISTVPNFDIVVDVIAVFIATTRKKRASGGMISIFYSNGFHFHADLHGRGRGGGGVNFR